MADNVAITPGTGENIAADDIGGVKVQRVKLTLGADGVNDGDVSSANPIPAGVIQNKVASTGNSSTSNLSAAATFTGTGISTSGFSAVQVSFIADKSCILQIQESPDNSSWVFPHAVDIIPASRVFRRTETVNSAYARVVVTNIDTGATTTLNLATMMCPIAVPDSPRPARGRTAVGSISTATTDANINVAASTSYVSIDTEGMGSVIVHNLTGGALTVGWVGTVVFDATQDGIHWEQVQCINPSVFNLTDTNRFFVKWTNSNTRGESRWIFNCSGYSQVRLRCSSFTSGPIPVFLTACVPTYYQVVPVRRNNTYTVSSAAFATAVLGATDIAALVGSATKTIKVLRVGYSAEQTAQDIENINLIKRSTANSGGTSTAMSVVAHDSLDGAPSSTAVYYTANPTLGTTVGSLRPSKVLVPANSPGSSATAQNEKVWDFTQGYESKPVYLRGTSESLVVNQNNAAFAGNSTFVWFEFTEE